MHHPPMPPRPFPFQLGIGTDIIYIPRIKRLLLKDGHDKAPRNIRRYMDHFLTHREQEIFKLRHFTGKRPDGLTKAWAQDEMLLMRVVRFLAGRWAAKEAVIKACRRSITFKHIQILLRTPQKQSVSGAVYGVVLDAPASAFAKEKPPLAEGSGGRSRKTGAGPRDSSNKERSSASVRESNPVKHFTPGREQNNDLEGQVVEVSISHDGEYVTAVCIAPREPDTGDIGGEAFAREP